LYPAVATLRIILHGLHVAALIGGRSRRRSRPNKEGGIVESVVLGTVPVLVFLQVVLQLSERVMEVWAASRRERVRVDTLVALGGAVYPGLLLAVRPHPQDGWTLQARSPRTGEEDVDEQFSGRYGRST
jgi:hypothetical protein